MGFTAGGAAGTAGAGLAIDTGGAGVWVAICGAAGGAGFTTGDGAGAAAAFGIVVVTPAERGCCGSVTASCCGGACGGCGSGKIAYFATSACALAIILPPSNLASFISFSQAVTTGSVALRQCATASGNSVTITSPRLGDVLGDGMSL